MDIQAHQNNQITIEYKSSTQKNVWYNVFSMLNDAIRATHIHINPFGMLCKISNFRLENKKDSIFLERKEKICSKSKRWKLAIRKKKTEKNCFYNSDCVVTTSTPWKRVNSWKLLLYNAFQNWKKRERAKEKTVCFTLCACVSLDGRFKWMSEWNLRVCVCTTT